MVNPVQPVLAQQLEVPLLDGEEPNPTDKARVMLEHSHRQLSALVNETRNLLREVQDFHIQQTLDGSHVAMHGDGGSDDMAAHGAATALPMPVMRLSSSGVGDMGHAGGGQTDPQAAVFADGKREAVFANSRRAAVALAPRGEQRMAG